MQIRNLIVMELIDAGDSLTAGDRVAKETGFLNKSCGFDAKQIYCRNPVSGRDRVAKETRFLNKYFSSEGKVIV